MLTRFTPERGKPLIGNDPFLWGPVKRNLGGRVYSYIADESWVRTGFPLPPPPRFQRFPPSRRRSPPFPSPPPPPFRPFPPRRSSFSSSSASFST
eukprot:612804-Pyramimonas_sp.AAC.1